jgi:sugar phosphate isomerase/epimerase
MTESPLRVATSLNVFDDYVGPIEDNVRRLAQAGFEGIDFNGIDVVRAWLADGGDRHVARLGAAAAAHGLVFTQAHGPMFKDHDDQCATAEPLIAACLRWSGRLGVPWMVMHPFTLPGATLAANREANVAFYRAWLPRMEACGVGIALENMSDHFSPHRRYGAVPEELADLCDTLDHPLFGLCWDTGHARLQELDQRAALGLLGARLKVLHVQDNNGHRDDHILPYTGTIDWSTVVAGLHAAGYAGAWCFEVHNAVRTLPDALRDQALALMVGIGRTLGAQVA